MSANRKRGVNSKPTKSDQVPKGPGKTVGDQGDGDSVSETGNNEQKVRKVGRPRKYPVGTPAATSGGNPASTPGKGSAATSSSSSSGNNDANKKSSSGASDSPKKVPKVKKALPTESKKKNVNKRAVAIEDTSKKAVEKLQKVKAKTNAKLLVLNKKKQLGIAKVVSKKKTVTKVKKSVGTKKNAKDAQTKPKSKSGATSGSMSSSSSSSSSVAKETKTSKAKKLAQGVETSENSSSKKAKKLVAKKVKLKKLATNVKTKVLNSSEKKKKKKEAVLVGGGKMTKAKKIASGAQATSVSKQKSAGKKSGQAASASNSSADDQKKGTLNLKKKPAPGKGSKRPPQKVVTSSGEKNKTSKVSKSLAEKVQKVKGKNLVKIEKTQKRKEADDLDSDVPAVSSKRKKMDSVDAKQPAIKKSRIADQRSEASVKATSKVSTTETLNKNVTVAEKPSASDKLCSASLVAENEGKSAEKEEPDISLAHIKRCLSKETSQEKYSIEPVSDIEKEQKKTSCRDDSDVVTGPSAVDNKNVTTPCKTEKKQVQSPACLIDTPCTVDSKQETRSSVDSSKQETRSSVDSSKQETRSSAESKQETRSSAESKQETRSSAESKQETRSSAESKQETRSSAESKQETRSSAESKQETRSSAESASSAESKQETPSSAESKQETPSSAESKQETPSSAESKQETPSSAESKQETPSSAESKQETPSSAENKQEAPSSAENKQEAPSTAENKQEAPSTAENRQEAPSTAENRQEAPSTAENRQEAPSTAENRQEAPFSVESKLKTSTFSEESGQETFPCSVDTKQDTTSSNISRQGAAPCSVDTKQETTLFSEVSQDVTSFPVKAKLGTTTCSKISRPEMVPCSVEAEQEPASSTVDSELGTDKFEEDNKEEMYAKDSKPVTLHGAIYNKEKIAACMSDTKQKKEIHKHNKTDDKQVGTPCTVDSEHESVVCTVKNELMVTPCTVEGGEVSAPCIVDGGHSAVSCTVDSKQKSGPCTVNDKPVGIPNLSKSHAENSGGTSQILSVKIAGRENKSNPSCSVSSEYANTPNSLPESVSTRLSSFMGSKDFTGFNQTESACAVDGKEKIVNMPKSEDLKSTCSVQNDELTKRLSGNTVVTEEKPDKLTLNVFEKRPKLPLSLDRTFVLDNSDSKVFNSLDKLKNKDPALAFQKSAGDVAAVQCQEKLIQNFLAPQTKALVSGVDSQEIFSSKNKTEPPTEDKSDNKGMLVAGDKRIVDTQESFTPSLAAAHRTSLQPSLQEGKASSKESTANENQKDCKISLDSSCSSSSGQHHSDSEMMPTLESAKKILLESKQEKPIFLNANSESVISQISSDVLGITCKLAESEPTKESNNLPKDFQEHHSIDSNIEKSSHHCDDISNVEHKIVLSKENVSESTATSTTNPLSKTDAPLIPVQKLVSDELTSPVETKVSISKSPPITPTYESSVVSLTSTKEQPSTVSCDKTLVTNLLQPVSGKDKNVAVASLSDLDTSLCEKSVRSVMKIASKVESASADVFMSHRNILPVLPKVVAASSDASRSPRNTLPSLINRPSAFAMMESLSTSSLTVTQSAIVTTNTTTPSSSLSSSSPTSTKVSLSTLSSSSKSAVNALKISHKDLSSTDSASTPPELTPSSAITPLPLSLKNDVSKTFSKEMTNFIHKNLVTDNLLSKPTEVTSKDDHYNSKVEGLILASKNTYTVQKEGDSSNHLENQGDFTKKSSVLTAVKDPCPNIFSKLDDLITSKLPVKERSLKELHFAIPKEKDKLSDLKSFNRIVSPETKEVSGFNKSTNQDIGHLALPDSETSTPHAKGSDIGVRTGLKSHGLTTEEVVLPSMDKDTEDSLNTETLAPKRVEQASCQPPNTQSDTGAKQKSLASDVNLVSNSQIEGETKNYLVQKLEGISTLTEECKDSAVLTNTKIVRPEKLISEQVKISEMKEAAKFREDTLASFVESTHPAEERSETCTPSIVKAEICTPPATKTEIRTPSTVKTETRTVITNTETSPTIKSEIQTSPTIKGEIQTTPTIKGEIQTSPTIKGENQTSPTIKGENQTTPTIKGENQTSPTIKGENQTSPTIKGENQTSPTIKGEIQTSPTIKGENQTSPTIKGEIQTTPTIKGENQTSPTIKGEIQTTPTIKGENQTSPTIKGENQTSPTIKGEIQTTQTIKGKIQTSPTNSKTLTPPATECDNLTLPAAENETLTPPAAENETLTPPAAENETLTPPAAEGETLTPPAAAVVESRTCPAAAVGESHTSPAAAEGESRTYPAVAEGESRTSPAAVEGESRTSPAAAEGESRTSPAVAGGESRTSPATAEGESRTFATEGESRTSPAAAEDKTRSTQVSAKGKAQTFTALTEGETRTSLAAIGDKARPSSSATGGETRPSPSATGGETRPSPSATGDETRPSPSATGDETRPSPSATGDETQTSPSATGDETRPSPSATGDETRPSPSATGDKTRPSPSATGDETRPSPSATGDETRPSPSATGDETRPSPSATGDETRPSPSATGDETRPSPSATGGGTRTSPSATGGGTRTSPSETGGGTRTSPSETEGETRTSPSETEGETRTSPSETEGETRTSPSETEGETRTSPSETEGETRTSPSETEGETRTSPSATEGETRTSPSATEGETRTSPSATEGETRTSPSATEGEIRTSPSATEGETHILAAAKGESRTSPAATEYETHTSLASSAAEGESCTSLAAAESENLTRSAAKGETRTSLTSLKCDPVPQNLIASPSSPNSNSSPKMQNFYTVKTSDSLKTETNIVENSVSVSLNDAVVQSALVKADNSQSALKNCHEEPISTSKCSSQGTDKGTGGIQKDTLSTLDTENNLKKDTDGCDEKLDKSLDNEGRKLSAEADGQVLLGHVSAKSFAQETAVENNHIAKEEENKSFSEKNLEVIESSKTLRETMQLASPLETTSDSEKALVDASNSKRDEEKPQQSLLVDESAKMADKTDKVSQSEANMDANKTADAESNVDSGGTNSTQIDSSQILNPEHERNKDDDKDHTVTNDEAPQPDKKADSQLVNSVSSNVETCKIKSAETTNEMMGENALKSVNKQCNTAIPEPPPTPYPPPYLSPQNSSDGKQAAEQNKVPNSSSPSSEIAQSKVVTRPSFVVLDNCFVCVICCQMCRSKRVFQAHIWWHFHVRCKLCNHCPSPPQNADNNVGLQQQQQQQPNKCPYVLDVMLKICRARKKMHRSIVRSDADQSNREKTFAEDETDTESVDLDYELDNGGSGGGGDSFGGKSTDQSLLSPPRGQDMSQSEKEGKSYTDLTDDNNSIFAPANVDYLRSLYSSGSKKRTKKSSSASNAQNHHHPHHHHHHHHHSSSSSSSSSTSSSMVAASAVAQKKGSFYVCGFQYCTYSCMNCLQFRLHLQQCHNFETVFPCYHCGQTNYSKDDLIKHMYNHSNARDFLLFRCHFPRCRFGTNMLQEFHEHNNIFHVGERVFTCFYCSTEFSELSQLLAHLQANLLKFVQCPHCTVKDRNRRTVLNHISTEHPLKPKQIVVTSQVVCKKKQTISPDQSLENSQHQQQVNLHRSLSEDRILECIKCGLLCRNIATLRKHSRVCLKDALSHKKSFASSPKENHWTLVYSCQWCSFPASSDTMLFQHTVDQHPGKNANFEQIELKISGTSGSSGDSKLSTSSWLEAAKSGAFICPYCKVAFHNERNWSEHMEREHNGDELDINGKKGLDGEMKYPCDFCEFNGTSEQDLVEHQQIMTATEGPDGMHRKVVDLANITPKVTLLTDTKLTVSNVLSFKRFKRSPSKKMNNAYFKCSGCHFRSLSKWQSLRHVKHCSLAKRRLSEYIRKRSTMDNGGSTDDVKIEPVDLDVKPLEIDEEPMSSASLSSDGPKTSLEDDEARSEWNTRMMSYMRDKQMNLMAKEGILDCTDTEGYRCSICRHTGKTMINIRQHLWKTHLKLKPVTCPCCPFTSWKNYTLEKHKISKHKHSHPNLSDHEMKTLAQNLQGTTDGLIECQLCFYKSPSSYKVRTHIWRTHMHIEMKQCSLCAYKCWYLYLMNMHQLSRHKSDKPRPVGEKPSKVEKEVVNNDDNGGKLTNDATDNISDLIGNSSIMSDEDMSLSAKGLMEKKAGSKYECCICRYECTRIMIMKIHIWKRHLNIKQRRCPQCPYICWLQSRLEQHICRIGTSGSSKGDNSGANIEASAVSGKESKSRWVISKADEFGCKLYINKSKRPPKRLSMDEAGQPMPKKFRSMSDGGSVTNSGGGGGGGRGGMTTTNFSKGSKNFSWIRHTWENSVTQSFFRVGCRKLFARTTDRVNQMEIFTCVYCSYKSWNMEAMCHHTYKHKLQCGYCLFRAYSRKKIMEHIEEFHQAPPKIIRDEHYKKYRMIFPSLGARRDKMRSKASIERQRRRRRGSARSGSSNVINVDDSEESDLDSESTSDWRPSSESEDDHVEEERVTRYCCCHCSMRTHDFDRFRKHVAKHSRSTEELQCPTCVYRTRDAYKFHQHIRRHPSEHFCGYCNFSSMQESFVQLHVRRVHPKKPVQIHIRSQTITAAADSNGGRTMNTSSVPAANFNVKVVLRDFLALDTVEFEAILKKNVIHSLDLENIILEEDKLLSVL